MSTQRIFSSRTKVALGSYIGHKGMLFFDEVSGLLRIGDGVTPGGKPIGIEALSIITDTLIPGTDNIYGIGTEQLRWNHIHLGDGGIYFDGTSYLTPQTVPYLPGALTGSLVPATDYGVNLGAADKRFANLYLGSQGLYLADQTTHANINITVNSGTLYIAGAENLRLGNLAIRDTTLTSSNPALDISMGAKDDTGFFYVNRKAQFDNTSFSSTEPMVSLNASGGADPLTIFPDTVMQTVGRPDKNSRIVQRSYGSSGNVGGDNSYSVWASYVARGTTAAPAALKANDILARISANGYGTTTWGSGGARVEFVALENFTDSAKGTRINFWTTPAGQIASQNIASINSVGIIAKGIEFSNDNTIQTTAGIPLTAKAISSATYVATLGVDGKLDTSQIPSSLSGAVVFKGAWNAATNKTAIGNYSLSDNNPSGVQAGWEYVVTVGGTVDIGDGSQIYTSGDFVIYDGSHWKHIVSANAFTYLKATLGGHLTVNGNVNTNEVGILSIASDATPSATTSTIVSRDASGNFSANVITANLTGVVTGSVSGNAGSVTNGVYTIGDQTIAGIKTFTSTIQGTITSATIASSVVGGYVSSITAGTGTSVSTSIGAITVWFNTSTLVANAVSATTATNAATAVSATTAKSATTATNLAVATSLFAGKLSAATGSIPKNSVATVTYTVTGLTTNHKIIITPGTVMPDRAFSVTAAWVSGADTISIQYANNTGGAISVTLDINYFAFV